MDNYHKLEADEATPEAKEAEALLLRDPSTFASAYQVEEAIFAIYKGDFEKLTWFLKLFSQAFANYLICASRTLRDLRDRKSAQESLSQSEKYRLDNELVAPVPDALPAVIKTTDWLRAARNAALIAASDEEKSLCAIVFTELTNLIVDAGRDMNIRLISSQHRQGPHLPFKFLKRRVDVHRASLVVELIQALSMLRASSHELSSIRAETTFAAEVPDFAQSLLSSSEAYLSVSDLAGHYELDRNQQDALRKRLDRWRMNNNDGWKESANRGSREPQFLYCIRIAEPIIRELKPSNERPANK